MRKKQPILKRLGERGFIFDRSAHRFYYTESQQEIKQYLESPTVRLGIPPKSIKLESIF